MVSISRPVRRLKCRRLPQVPRRVLLAAAEALPSKRYTCWGMPTANPTPTNGNAFNIANATAKEVGVLCDRLAPLTGRNFERWLLVLVTSRCRLLSIRL